MLSLADCVFSRDLRFATDRAEARIRARFVDGLRSGARGTGCGLRRAGGISGEG